jgi:hypothetical protein
MTEFPVQHLSEESVHPIHDLSHVPEHPQASQWRIVRMPCAFVCCMCRDWKPINRVVTAYWDADFGWWGAACAYHRPVSGFHPNRAMHVQERGGLRGNDIASSIDDAKAEVAIAAKAAHVYCGHPRDVSKDDSFQDTLRALWHLVYTYGIKEPPPMYRVLAIRGITYANRDVFVRRHPAIRLMVAALAELVGLDLTAPAKRKVQGALINCQSLGEQLP